MGSTRLTLRRACCRFEAIGRGHESVTSARQAARMLTALRLARVLVHLLIALDVALAFGRRSDKARRAFMRWWARGLLAALGIRVKVEGESVLCEPALLVANRVSWL